MAPMVLVASRLLYGTRPDVDGTGIMDSTEVTRM